MSLDTKINPIKLTEDSNFYFGLSLAVSSSLFIGTSFIIKKKALLRLNRKGCLRAGSGGYGYLREWIWWIGLLCMGTGEISNFAAYAFAPASLVTPLGALSVLVSAVLSSIYLKENLNVLGKMGCILCILGSTIIVIHSPMTEQQENFESLIAKLKETTFICYITFIIFISSLIIFHFGPKYGKRNVIWYILICSTIGSLTVIFCKILGVTIRESIAEKSMFSHVWLMGGLATIIIFCIIVQMIYLNRALDLFNASIVTPLYYVFFTTFVLLASNILLKEWRKLSFIDVVGSLSGFFVVVVAVLLLNAFKDVDLNVGDIFKPKRDVIEDSSNNSNNSYDYE